MANTNKSGLDNVLQSVLSVGNKEANQNYPPSIFSRHFNAVTSFLLDKLVELYPYKSDLLLPFLRTLKNPITNGGVPLPGDYRNYLSFSISVKPDGSDCSDVPTTATSFKIAGLKSGCKTVPIEILSRKEWDYRTTSTYAFPTIENPIGVFKEGQLKVCPYDLAKCEINYVKKENLYSYGYVLQPDDTYIFNVATSVESEWSDNAFQPLFKGVLALYSAYLRDNQLTEFSGILNEKSLF